MLLERADATSRMSVFIFRSSCNRSCSLGCAACLCCVFNIMPSCVTVAKKKTKLCIGSSMGRTQYYINCKYCLCTRSFVLYTFQTKMYVFHANNKFIHTQILIEYTLCMSKNRMHMDTFIESIRRADGRRDVRVSTTTCRQRTVRCSRVHNICVFSDV